MLRKPTIYFCLLALTLFSIRFLSAAQNTLRIQELIPEDWVEYPAIEPAIPSNYILAEVEERTIWGTKEDIAICETDVEQIKSELISLSHSYEMVQTGPDTFSLEAELEQTFAQLQVKEFKLKKLNWGKYPVLAIEGLRPNGTRMHAAWVGLNSEQGLTLFMTHCLPKNGDNSCPVWKNLLANTKQLEEREFFRAKGMDMQEGYTINTLASASVKATAEKRISDDLLVVKIEPLSPETTYEIERVGEYLMGTEWKHKVPCTKISGSMTQKEGKYGTLVLANTITVLTKKVTDFSFDLDQNQHPKGTLILQLPQTNSNIAYEDVKPVAPRP